MKKKLIILSLLVSLFMVPAAALNMDIVVGLGAESSFVRAYGSETVAFKIGWDVFSVDAGVRFLEDFVPSKKVNYMPLFITPNLMLHFGGFYFGAGYTVNFKSDSDLPLVIKSGYTWDIIDLDGRSCFGLDSGLEFSHTHFEIDDKNYDFGNWFNLLKLYLHITYRFRI